MVSIMGLELNQQLTSSLDSAFSTNHWAFSYRKGRITFDLNLEPH